MDKAIEKFNKATENFEKYVDFWVKFRPSIADKIMFCVSRGLHSPRELVQKLQIAKGNLANSCKELVADGQLLKQVQGRIVKYRLSAKGNEHIRKFLRVIASNEAI